MNDDILVEVPREEVPQILADMKNDWPSSMLAYNFLKNSCVWEAKEPAKTFQVLRPSSSGLNGIFITIVPYTSKVSLWATEGMHGALKDFLMSTHKIDWYRGNLLFAGLNMSEQQVLLSVLQKKGVTVSHVEHCTAYWMPATQAATLQPQCPQGTHFGLLDETHAEFINSRWTYGTLKTLTLIQNILRLNPCWGLFVTDSKHLAAWCLVCDYGVGILRTEEQYRRKGYAQAVARHVFRQLGEEGTDVHLHVEKNNVSAHHLFKMLGCCTMGDVFWTDLLPQT